MARVRSLLLIGVCVLVTLTSVQSKLSMHQQHLKMHQELLKTKGNAAGLPAQQANTAQETLKPATNAAPPTEEPGVTGKHSASEAPPIKPSEVNPSIEVDSLTEDAPRSDKAPIDIKQEAPESEGGTSSEPNAGGPDQKEAPKTRDDALKYHHKGGSSTKSSNPPKIAKESTKEPHTEPHATPAKDPVSKDETIEDEEQPTILDEEVIFIDEGEEEAEEEAEENDETYPDPDLDNEDGGIGDLDGEGDLDEGGEHNEESEEEEEEEEDYHHEDYSDDRHQDEEEHKPRSRDEGREVIGSLAYNDLEDVLYEERYVMLHFVAAGCERCEKFRPHFVEAARKFWLVEDNSGEDQPTIYFYEVTDHQLLVRFNLRELPTVFFFRNGVPILYEGDLNTDDLQRWTFAHLDVLGWSLTEENFDKETKDTKDEGSTSQWMVHFCDVDVVGCDGFMATWESTASRMKNDVMFGYVDVGVEVALVKRFNVDPKKLPAIVLLKQGQAYWCTLPLIELTTDNLVHFVTEGHLMIQEDPVPSTLSTLAVLIVKACANIKGIGLVLMATTVVLGIIYIFLCRKRSLKNTGKEKGV